MSVEVEKLKEELVAAIRREEALTAAVRDLAEAAEHWGTAQHWRDECSDPNFEPLDPEPCGRCHACLIAIALDRHASIIRACRENPDA